MEDFFIMNAVSLLSLIISIFTLLIVFSQMRIAAAKVRLDLYNKRFAVLESTIDLYLATWDWNDESIRPLELQFIKYFRESQFLFDEEAEIYNTLEKIKDCNAAISAYEKEPKDGDSTTEDRKEYLHILHKRSATARIEFATNLTILENKMKTYLDFKALDGWKFLPSK